ncbi:MAG: deoxyhypusine synthase [candidate division KSB1 bacterium]|nr:deoxyhypusine synthase [candidate division KSB1 bacterium]
MRKKEDFLHTPIKPLEVRGEQSTAELLESMRNISFQGRSLAEAFYVWKEMLQGETLIFLGLAGAMVPAGMRKVISYLIQHRFIDCLVSTGANLFHDCHETLGKHHFKGSPWLDDLTLYQQGIDRFYDTLASEAEFRQTDQFIAHFAEKLDLTRPYTTREFFKLLGQELLQVGVEEGILTSAVTAGVPIFCPAIADSSYGIALAYLYHTTGKKLVFDVIKDVEDSARLVIQASRTGVIYVGGGTPKNFIQQTEITASILGHDAQGHKYAIQLTTDMPQWGGLSGCTFEEAQSWGKIARQAEKVTVNADATIALPFLVTALDKERENLLPNRKVPQLKFD